MMTSHGKSTLRHKITCPLKLLRRLSFETTQSFELIVALITLAKRKRSEHALYAMATKAQNVAPRFSIVLIF